MKTPDRVKSLPLLTSEMTPRDLPSEGNLANYKKSPGWGNRQRRKKRLKEKAFYAFIKMKTEEKKFASFEIVVSERQLVMFMCWMKEKDTVIFNNNNNNWSLCGLF